MQCFRFIAHESCAAQQCPPQVRRETVVLHLAQVEESSSAPEEAQTPGVTSTQENEDPQATAAPPPSIIESGRSSGQDSPADAPGSPHKEFHSAVLKALGCDAESERDGPSAGITCHLPAESCSFWVYSDFAGLFFFLPVSRCPWVSNLGDPTRLSIPFSWQTSRPWIFK